MLGGDVGYFMVRTQEAGRDVHHVLLACDPLWGFEYVASDSSSKDPWLRYAAGHSAPVRAADITCLSDQERAVVASAAKYGFGDAVLVPAPSPQGRSRFALLVIGSRDSEMRSRFDVPGYRAAARDVAMALHERWADKLRREFIRSSDLSRLDLRVLELELTGCGTKEIARELRSTNASVNSRFQRLNQKLRVTSRRAAALRAMEFGLIYAHSPAARSRSAPGGT